MTDQYLIDKILINDDQQAFEKLVNNHKAKTFSLIYQIIRQRENAEDVLQLVFLKVYQNLKSFNKESKFSTWLYRIAYNSALNYQKQSYVKQKSVDIDENCYKIPDVNSNSDKTELVRHIISKLDEKTRIVIVLFYLENYSSEEISEIVGLSLSNVKVILHRGRKKMYDILQKV